MKNKIICIMLILTVLAGSMQIFAATKSQLNNQSSEINSKISDTKEEIGEIEANLSGVMKDVQNLISQISMYESSISDLNNKIEDAENQIKEKEQAIEKAQKDINEKQELLEKRLVALYESGNTSYLELLLSSADLSDFISKYYLISELATYDTELIEGVRQSKADLETSKAEIEKNKEEIEKSKSELVEKKNSLANAKSEKDKKAANLTSEEKALKKELEDLEKEKKEIDREIEAILRAEAEASKGNSNNKVTGSSGAGYIFPVSGCSRANINNKNYPSYSGHTGIDVNRNVVGKNVVAVKDGTVTLSKAYKNSNGTYKSYGEFVLINHHDGTYTGYAHMTAGSRRVQNGDKVKQGQVIGTVGSTGNSTGPHLHFEVRLGGATSSYCVNPLPYLP